jgi:hypothetical protein
VRDPRVFGPRGVVTVEAVNFFDAVGVGLLRPG